MTKNQYTHCVVYRMGGTDNFTWHRSLAMTKERAMEIAKDDSRLAYAMNYKQSLLIGLPEDAKSAAEPTPDEIADELGDQWEKEDNAKEAALSALKDAEEERLVTIYDMLSRSKW